MHTAHRSCPYPFLLFLLVLPLLALPGAASAIEVTVSWSQGGNATQGVLGSRAEAMESAFRTAVFREALGILPGRLPEERQDLLWSHLAGRAPGLVQGYAELGREKGEGATVLIMDVMVNRQALREHLQRTGIYYTSLEPRPFELRIAGDAAPHWDTLGRLKALSGVNSVSGAEPVMTLELTGNGTWRGSLAAGDLSWASMGEDLEKVWFDLWAGYHASPGAEAGTVGELFLRVEGWTASDGTADFDAILRSWEEEVEDAVLVRLFMLPTGVGGVWKVRSLCPDALAARLDAFLPPRGLRHVLGRTEDQASVPAAVASVPGASASAGPAAPGLPDAAQGSGGW